LQANNIFEACDAGNGIVFIPKNVKQKLTKEHFFEIVEKIWARNRNIDSPALGRTIINRAVRACQARERAPLATKQTSGELK
jgi:hypothetical protein